MKKKPNVVMFCTDHLRADYLSCARHPLIKTPNLDRLAARGVRYENIYVQNTVCMPSRASILTGTYPCRHTVTCNGYNLPAEHKTIAHVLRDAGYHTMAVGRTHVICTQPRPEYSKTDFYGFNQCSHAQVYCGDTDPDNDYLAWIREEHGEYYDDIAFINSKGQDDDLLGSRTTVPQELSMNSWVVGRSLKFIQEHKDKSPEQPFLLWAGTWDPHSPYRAPEPWGSMYDPAAISPPRQIQEEFDAYPDELKRLATVSFQRNPDIPMEEIWRNTIAMYMGMISHIDDQLGKLLDGLDEMGLIENTIVLFTSDHGDMMGEHWFIGKRIYFYDDALKVPAIMAGPSMPGETVFEDLAESVDLTPTLLDLVSVPIPPEAFNPTELDCGQWARTVKEAGGRYMVMTAKHHCGFANWPSFYTKFSVESSNWRKGKGDVVREFVDACRENDLKTGLYCSPVDMESPVYDDPKAYDDYFINQMTELTEEKERCAGGERWLPQECDFRIRDPNWFYSDNDSHTLKSSLLPAPCLKGGMMIGHCSGAGYFDGVVSSLTLSRSFSFTK